VWILATPINETLYNKVAMTTSSTPRTFQSRQSPAVVGDNSSDKAALPACDDSARNPANGAAGGERGGEAANQRDEGLSLAMELRGLAAEIERDWRSKPKRSFGERRWVGISQVRSGKWTANVTVDRRLRHLGTFDTAEAAARARDAAVLAIPGYRPRLNFPAKPDVTPGAHGVQLSDGQWALVDEADAEFVSRFLWQATGNKSSTTTYVKRTCHGADGVAFDIKLHRELLGIADPDIDVDHINGNGLDNRRQNLRACDSAQNMHNARMSRNNTSGFKGVSWHGKSSKWRATITLKRKHICVGLFRDKVEAARAYDKAAVELYGEFARTNESMGLLPALCAEVAKLKIELPKGQVVKLKAVK
jgi:hypothetical protein